jgi:hypothetical protein
LQLQLAPLHHGQQINDLTMIRNKYLRGKAVQVDPMKSQLKPPGTQLETKV